MRIDESHDDPLPSQTAFGLQRLCKSMRRWRWHPRESRLSSTKCWCSSAMPCSSCVRRRQLRRRDRGLWRGEAHRRTLVHARARTAAGTRVRDARLLRGQRRRQNRPRFKALGTSIASESVAGMTLVAGTEIRSRFGERGELSAGAGRTACPGPTRSTMMCCACKDWRPPRSVAMPHATNRIAGSRTS